MHGAALEFFLGIGAPVPASRTAACVPGPSPLAWTVSAGGRCKACASWGGEGRSCFTAASTHQWRGPSMSLPHVSGTLRLTDGPAHDLIAWELHAGGPPLLTAASSRRHERSRPCLPDLYSAVLFVHGCVPLPFCMMYGLLPVLQPRCVMCACACVRVCVRISVRCMVCVVYCACVLRVRVHVIDVWMERRRGGRRLPPVGCGVGGPRCSRRPLPLPAPTPPAHLLCRGAIIGRPLSCVLWAVYQPR
jgi:hypothetical protein